MASMDNVVVPALHSSLPEFRDVVNAAEECPQRIRHFITQRLTTEQSAMIWLRFKKTCKANCQVLWTGMTRESAQRWADSRGMQTLTTAIGPYMDCESRLCPRRSMSAKAWTEYIHGASAIFALFISNGEHVTVLCHPPPERFHPLGNTGFQCIEAPILTGQHGNRAVKYVDIVHPLSNETAAFSYQIWPEDHVKRWTQQFGGMHSNVLWRKVKVQTPTWSLARAKNDVFNKRLDESALTCQTLRHTRRRASCDDNVARIADNDVESQICMMKAQHKKQLGALNKESHREMVMLATKRKHDRSFLNQKELKEIKGLSKVGKKVVRREISKLREELRRKHEEEKSNLQENLMRKRQQLQGRHKAEMESAETLRRGLKMRADVKSAPQHRTIGFLRLLFNKMVILGELLYRSWPMRQITKSMLALGSKFTT